MRVSVTMKCFKNNFLWKRSCYLYNCHHHFLEYWVLQNQSALMYVFTNTPGATPCILLYVNYALFKVVQNHYSKDQCMSPLASRAATVHMNSKDQDDPWGHRASQEEQGWTLSKPGSGAALLTSSASVLWLNLWSFWIPRQPWSHGQLEIKSAVLQMLPLPFPPVGRKLVLSWPLEPSLF